MSNTFKLCPTYFSKGGEKFAKGDFVPLRPPWLRACDRAVVPPLVTPLHQIHSKSCNSVMSLSTSSEKYTQVCINTNKSAFVVKNVTSAPGETSSSKTILFCSSSRDMYTAHWYANKRSLKVSKSSFCTLLYHEIKTPNCFSWLRFCHAVCYRPSQSCSFVKVGARFCSSTIVHYLSYLWTS